MIQQHNTTASGTEIDVIDFNYVPSSASPDPPVNPFPCTTGENFHRTTYTRSEPTVLPPALYNSFVLGRRSNSPFRDEVTTSLPYHVSSVRLPLSFYACMIDDERIVGIQVRILFWFFFSFFFFFHFFSRYVLGPASFVLWFFRLFNPLTVLLDVFRCSLFGAKIFSPIMQWNLVCGVLQSDRGMPAIAWGYRKFHLLIRPFSPFFGIYIA